MNFTLYNRLKLLYTLVATLLFASSFAANDEIIVRLATDVQLLQMSMEPIQNEKADFSNEYLKELRDVLLFDMNNNGMTKVVPSKEAIGFDAPVDFEKCKDRELFYIIKLKMAGKKLAVKVVSVSGKSTKLIEDIVCTGELSSDRKTIHHVADVIHEQLFHKPGIASSRILFTMRQTPSTDPEKPSQWTSEVFESDYDGANRKQLTHENAYIVTPLFALPSIALKNSALIFTSYKIGQPKIYYISSKDGKTRRLTTLRGNQLTPAISSDGTKIAFACDTTGRSDLFLQEFQTSTGSLGKPVQIFTAKGAANASPTFSPDGKKIAFVSNKDGSPKIYVMDIPKKGMTSKDLRPVLISKQCRENSAPAWSPDGKKLAYSAKSGAAPRQIWIYDFDRKQEHRLTDGKGDKENPAWAANSLHLLFNSTDKEITELYLVNLNQPKATKITTGAGEKRFPYWK